MRRLYKEYLTNKVMETSFKAISCTLLLNKYKKERFSGLGHYTLLNRESGQRVEGRFVNSSLPFSLFVFDAPSKGFIWKAGSPFDLLDENNEKLGKVMQIVELYERLPEFVEAARPYDFACLAYPRFKHEYAPKEIFPLTGYYDEFVDKYYEYEEILPLFKKRPYYVNRYRSYIRYMDNQHLRNEEGWLLNYMVTHKDEFLPELPSEPSDKTSLEHIAWEKEVEYLKKKPTVFDVLEKPLTEYFHLPEPYNRIKIMIDHVNGKPHRGGRYEWYATMEDAYPAKEYIEKHPELIIKVDYK